MAGPATASSMPRPSALVTLGWGFYLAVSWTWVIGMILPALLLRDLGWWSLAVFLVPNAVGAALMGTVLKDPEVAQRVRHTHDKAIRRFSMVTIAFHLFVLSVVAFSRPGFPTTTGQVGVLIFGTIFALLLLTIRRWLVSALVVWLASVGLAIAYATGDSSAVLADPQFFDSAIPKDLLLLTPVVVFGFALCPYLDATFLRARMSTGRASGRVAFAFGFLAPFVIMIAFTVLYSGIIASGHSVGWKWVLAHLALQGGFTLAVHLRESKLTFAERGVTLGLTLVALAAAWSLPTGPISWADGMLAWEVVYRMFLSAYGLFFPAYVLFAMVPAGLGLGPLTRVGRAVVAVTVALVLPMYAMGFIARQEQWLPLAFGLVLAGACITFILRRRAGLIADG